MFSPLFFRNHKRQLLGYLMIGLCLCLKEFFVLSFTFLDNILIFITYMPYWVPSEKGTKYTPAFKIKCSINLIRSTFHKSSVVRTLELTEKELLHEFAMRLWSFEEKVNTREHLLCL
ncbi:hypothetical protein RND81_13G057900 [Saponaria officinalis]|uniref:Uncharacterized protein n=1 Tax=Saponaria officinalis TaxID=3572 RepID=A0AAW1H2W6_SAPOF